MIQLRQTVRRLLKAPGFTLTTVLTLAIGIGATTAIFSVINGILIKPLPFPESERLIALVHESPGDNATAASPALYFTYREHNETFESIALWASDTASITGARAPEQVRSLEVTHEFLTTLGVRPTLGRSFTAADDEQGSPATVVLAYDYWQRVFRGDETAIGESLVVDGSPATVIGVLPRGFRFLQQPADLLVPMKPLRAIAYFGPTGERGIARLKKGITLAEASADVERMIPIAKEIFAPPPRFGVSREALAASQFGPNLQFLRDNVVGDLDTVLWVLMGTVGMLLLIACANAANLHLVRTEGRGHELAIQAALGASRRVIARSLLLESVVLGLAGGTLGLAFAAAALPVLLAMAAEHLPTVLEISIDPSVVMFTLAISFVSGLLFGALPVLRNTGLQVVMALATGGRSYSTGRERHRARNTIVVAQVALALMLLIASGLMIRTFQSLRDVEPGFAAPERVQTFEISMPQGSVPDFGAAIRRFDDIQDRLGDVAGVESVGFASMVPLGGDGPDGGASLDQRGERIVPFEFRFTSRGFFETLRTPLVAGRHFERSDYIDDDRPQGVVVSESLARRQWGSPEGALGKRMRRSPGSPWVEIVGVVGDVHLEGVDQPAPDAVYFTLRDELAQWMSRTVTFVVRSERIGTPGFLEDIQGAIWSVDPSLPLASVQTLGDLYERSMARTALTLVLLAITGGMALLLGLVGIYGVISYTLAQRTREIGIRMALGARDAALKRMLLGRVLALVLVGAVLGVGGAAAMSRLMESLLFGVTALDPATYALVAVMLVATAAVAGYLPARRVTRVDPMQALRAE
jgi:predicted permease